MKINIVTERSPGWVLRNISESLQKHLSGSYITDYMPDGNGDVNLYINYALLKKKTCKIDVGWFTHRENDSFDSIANMADYCIAMCDKTASMLPPNKTIVIQPGVDPQFIKTKIVVGCCGKHQQSGRKQFDLIEELRCISGIEIIFTNQKYAWSDMPSFYEKINYLLILSTNEGGPMPALEAIAMGKPIIAPNVGWCWDYPVIKYNSIEQLKKMLALLVTSVDSWKISADKTYNVLEQIYGGRILRT